MRRTVPFATLRFALVVFLALLVPRLVAAGTITLAWDANPESDIAGYVLSYGTSPGIYTTRVDVGNVTSTRLTSLTDNVVYYFAVAAYNRGGLSSSLSAEVSGLPTPAAPPPIAIASLTADKTFPVTVGTTVTWTTQASGGTTLEYRYWLWDATNGWVSRPYSPSNQFSWTPTSADVGNHQVQVDVRNVGVDPPTTQQTPVFSVQAPPSAGPATVTALTSSTSQPRVGVAMVWTPTVSGGTAPLLYRYEVYRSGSWTIVQNWGPTSTLTWTPAQSGNHRIRVRVRSNGVTSGYDSQYATPTFKVAR
jgi:hypothetical protein